MTASAAIDTNLVTSGIAMGAGRLQRLGFVVLPATLPDVIGALKIAAALTLLGVLLAELMISIDGVGSFIAKQIVNHQAARLDAMILIVCVGVILVITALSAIERRALRVRD
jgi:NitT/TauT family transport system permease protein